MPATALPRPPTRTHRFTAVGLAFLFAAAGLVGLAPEAAAWSGDDGGITYTARDNLSGSGGPTNQYTTVTGSMTTPCNAAYYGDEIFIDEFGTGVPSDFDFEWYGNPISNFVVTENGGVSFAGGAAGELGFGVDPALPTSGDPRDFVAPFWTDHATAGSGEICVRTTGAVGERTAEVWWDDVPTFTAVGPAAWALNSALLLVFEEGDVVEFHYADGDNLCADPNAFAVVGIEGGDGASLRGIEYLALQPAACMGATTPGRAIQFRPSTSFPTANDDSYTFDYATSTMLDVGAACGGPVEGLLCNDVQLGNVPLRPIRTTAVSPGGSAVVYPDGSFHFIPAAKDPCNGGDPYTFSYRADDAFPDGTGSAPQDQAVVSVTVTNCSASPAPPLTPTALRWAPLPTTVAVATPIHPAPYVAVVDADGRIVDVDGAEVTLTLSGGTAGASIVNAPGQRPGQAVTVATEDGIALFKGLAIDTFGSGYTLTASIDGIALSDVTSSAIEVNEFGADWAFYRQDGTRQGTTGGIADLSTPWQGDYRQRLDDLVAGPALSDLNGDSRIDLVVMERPTGGKTSSPTFQLVVHGWLQNSGGTMGATPAWSRTIPFYDPANVAGAPQTPANVGHGQVAIAQLNAGPPEVLAWTHYAAQSCDPITGCSSIINGALHAIDGASGALIDPNGIRYASAVNAPILVGDFGAGGSSDIAVIDVTGNQLRLNMAHLAGTTLTTRHTTGLGAGTGAGVAWAEAGSVSVASGELRPDAGDEIVIGIDQGPDRGLVLLCAPNSVDANCTEQVELATGVRGIAIADIDHDGRNDIIINVRGDSSGAILPGSQVPLAAAAMVRPTPSDAPTEGAPAVSDIDGDGLLDLLQVQHSISGGSGTDVIVRTTDGGQSDVTATGATSGLTSAHGPVAFMANGTYTGASDVVFGADDGRLRGYSSSDLDDELFSTVLPGATAAIGPVAVADVTSDCRPDPVATAGARVYWTTGVKGTVPTAPSFASPTDYEDAATWTDAGLVTSPGWGKQARLVWNAPSSDGGLPIVAYDIQRATNETGPYTDLVRWPSGTPPTLDEPFIDDLSDEGYGTYYYKVQPVTCYTANYGGALASDSFMSEVQPPAAATNLTATVAEGGIPAYEGPVTVQLDWTAAADNFARPHGCGPVDGYNVYRRTAAGSFDYTAPVNPNVVPATTLSDQPAVGGVYVYRVRAVNCVAEQSPGTAEMSVDLRVPLVPTDLSATPTPDEVALSWTAPAEIRGCGWLEGYVIERADSAGGPYTKIATVKQGADWAKAGAPADPGAPAVTFADTTVSAATTYYYRVAAVNCIGASLPTAALQVDVSSGGNVAPVVVVASGLSVLEDATLTLDGINATKVTDAGASDSVDEELTLETAPAAALGLATVAGLTFMDGADGDDRIVVRGNLADLNAALDGLTVTPALDYCGNVTLTATVDDLGNEGAGGPKTGQNSTSIVVTCVDDAPTVDTPLADPSTINEEGSFSTPDFLLGLTPGGGADEASQDLFVDILSVTNTMLFASGPTLTVSGDKAALDYTGATDKSGTSEVCIRIRDSGSLDNGGQNITDSVAGEALCFDITILPENDVPDGFQVDTTRTLLEDTFDNQTLLATDPDTGYGDVMTYSIVTGPTSGVATLDAATGDFNYTPDADFVGADSVTVSACDQEAECLEKTIQFTVTEVNDAPALTLGVTSASMPEDGVPLLVDLGASVDVGPASEAGQSVLGFVVTGAPTDWFSTPPSVQGGSIVLQPAADACGDVTLQIAAQDDGGTANGGVDTSAPVDFVLSVTCINDPPQPDLPADVRVLEDAGAQSIPFILGLVPGPAGAGDGNETGQGLGAPSVSTPAPALFSVLPSLSGSDLRFTTAPDACGATVVELTVADDGGTANGGVDNVTVAVPLVITCVNDPPSAAVQDLFFLEDETAATIVVPGFVSGIKPGGGSDEDGQTVSFSVSFGSVGLLEGPVVDQAGTLSFRLARDACGHQRGTLTVRDDGGISDGGDDDDERQFGILVRCVNDAPLFAPGPPIEIYVGGAPAVEKFPGWATGINPGAASEANQKTWFTVAVDPADNLDSVEVDPDGTLRAKPALDKFGLTALTVCIHDDGGTANGGVDAGPCHQSTIDVRDRNDPPTFLPGEDITVLEDSPPFTAGWGTFLSAGPKEGHQTLWYDVKVGDPGMFAQAPTLTVLNPDANGDVHSRLSFIPAPDAFGTTTVTVRLRDDGGTSGGGADSSGPVTFAITISPLSDPPTARDDMYTMQEDGHLEIAAPGVLGNDIEPDLETLTAHLLKAPEHGTATLKPDGVLRYTPPEDFFGTVELTYEARDPTGRAATATVTILVENVNDRPIAVEDYYAMRPGVRNQFDVSKGLTANDVDIDGDPLSVRIGSLAPVPGRDGTYRTQHGVLTIHREGAFSYTPDDVHPGYDDFTYQAEDPHGGRSAPTIVRIRITDNDAPVAQFKATNLEVALGTPIGFQDESYDPDAQGLAQPDAENPDLGIVAWEWDFGDGTPLATDQHPVHNYTEAGTYHVRLLVRDQEGGEGTSEATITVLAAYRPDQGGDERIRPVVEAGMDIFAAPDAAVKLVGTLTAGSANRYEWRQLSGTPVDLFHSDKATAYLNAPAVPEGAWMDALAFQVRAFDGVQWSQPDGVMLYVYKDGIIPSMAAEDRVVRLGETVRLKATATGFPAPPLQQWTQVAGPSVGIVGLPGDGVSFTVPAYARNQTLQFHVVGMVDGLRSPPTLVEVFVEEPKPQVQLVSTRLPDGSYRFEAAGGTGHAWDFGDGATASGPAVVHQYRESGTYEVRLTSEGGETGTTQVWVPEALHEAESGTPSIIVENAGIIALGLLALVVVCVLAGVVLTRK